MAITQKDIAQHLGVSRPWVARALAGDARISEGGRAKVLAAAKEMGYRPEANWEARTLAASRHGRKLGPRAIGCISFAEGSGTLLPYAAAILEGVNRVAIENEVELFVLQHEPSTGWEKADGLLLHSASSAQLERARDLGVPVVTMMGHSSQLPGVDIEDEAGARQATEYLLDLGHRRIGYLLDTHVGEAHAMRRLRGYETALRSRQIEPDPTWVGPLMIDNAAFLQRGRDSMRAWMRAGWSSLGLTALLVQNDRAAMGAMQVLQDAGLRIPQDLSIVGFDSTDECEIVRPHLTSIHAPLQDVGALATQLLLDVIRDRPIKAPHLFLPVALEVRSSTSRPP